MTAEEEERRRASSSSSSSSCPLSSAAFLHCPASPVLGLALALGASSLTTALLPAAQPPRALSVAITVANEALRGAKALGHLHSPAHSLLFASETLVKGYKFSTTLNLIRPNKSPRRVSLSSVVRTLKPCLGAIGVVRYVRSPVQDFGFLGFDLLSYGYRFSGDFFKVLRGVGGFEMGVALKNGFDSLGLVVKAVKVARELKQIRGGVNDCQKSNGCFHGREGRSAPEALHVDCGIECAGGSTFSPSDCASSRRGKVGPGAGLVEEERFFPVSKLLCLPIPVADDRRRQQLTIPTPLPIISTACKCTRN